MMYVWLIVGFILLIKGADFFVDGSSQFARIFRVPSIIIGLTIVAMGTSLPEFAVSISAALRGSNEIAISNVVGSNFFNLLMVCGICALIKPLPIDKMTLKHEFPFSIFVGFLLLLLSADYLIKGKGVDNIISRVDGIILLILFFFFLRKVIHSAWKARKENSANEHQPEEKNMSVIICLFLMTIGITAIKFGGDMVVDSASDIAASFGLSENLIGLTIVAVGTSLPELVTSIVATRKGDIGLAIGNVVGSNIFNILFVLGISAAIQPMVVNMKSVHDLIFLGVTSIVVWIFAYMGNRLNRFHGVAMIGSYLAYMIYVCVR